MFARSRACRIGSFVRSDHLSSSRAGVTIQTHPFFHLDSLGIKMPSMLLVDFCCFVFFMCFVLLIL